MYARCGFFRAANEPGKKIAPRCVKHINQISAVINDNIRLDIERLIEEYGVFFLGTSMPCKDMDSLFHERCRNIILRRQRIAARNSDLCAGVLEDCRHIGGLRLKMQCNHHLDAGKRLCDRILLVSRRHYWHKALHPVNLCVTRRCECNISNH